MPESEGAHVPRQCQRAAGIREVPGGIPTRTIAPVIHDVRGTWTLSHVAVAHPSTYPASILRGSTVYKQVRGYMSHSGVRSTYLAGYLVGSGA